MCGPRSWSIESDIDSLERETCGDFEATAGARTRAQRSSEDFDSLFHALQTLTARSGRCSSTPVVHHPDVDRVRLVADLHEDFDVRSTMFEAIGERLLHDAIGAGVDGGGELGSMADLLARHDKAACDVAVDEFFQFAEPRCRTALIGGVSAEDAEHLAHLAQGLSARLLDLVQRRGRAVWVLRQDPSSCTRLHDDDPEPVGDHVVKFAGDAVAFTLQQGLIGGRLMEFGHLRSPLDLEDVGLPSFGVHTQDKRREGSEDDKRENIEGRLANQNAGQRHQREGCGGETGRNASVGSGPVDDCGVDENGSGDHEVGEPEQPDENDRGGSERHGGDGKEASHRDADRRGHDQRPLQRMVGARHDGDFGPRARHSKSHSNRYAGERSGEESVGEQRALLEEPEQARHVSSLVWTARGMAASVGSGSHSVHPSQGGPCGPVLILGDDGPTGSPRGDSPGLSPEGRSRLAPMLCSSCGSALTSGARFCSNCGTPQASSDEERRIVTVVFADIVGFTGLAEALDPEDVKHLIDRCVERLASDIVSFGGVVDKVLGDAIVALFGAPIAHEDDAERAVRASLRMQQSVSALANETGQELRLRIGVNTGEVLVGMSSAGGDYTAMGDVMNIASRLEALAEPGQVVVGHATHQATQEAISYRPLGQVEARGREATVEAWVALSAVRPPGARTRRTTAFAGRERELALIASQARLATETSLAQATTIVGEAGMGKTRLAEEAAAMLASTWNARILEGRAVPYGEANVWWPIAEVLRHAFGLSIETSADDARSALLGGLSIHLDPRHSADIPRFTTGLMHALGYATPLRGGDRERNRSEVTLALVSILEAEVKQRPVVLVLSDVHWAADAVWDLLSHLLHELARTPLIVLMTAKGHDTMHPLEGRHGSLVLPLGPLDPEASRAMVEQLGLDLPDDVMRQLVERSGGNPFFLEELAGLVASRQESGNESEVVAALSSGRIESLPDNLRGIIAARLDAIDPAHRTVLESAAILGNTGPIDGLATMLAATEDMHDITPALADLVDRDLITINGPRYSFRSDMVRDVAYGTLTKTNRALGHHGIATYLDNMADEDVRNSRVVAIADHYRSAAELVIELNSVPGVDRATVVAKALHWLAEAGERALEAGVPTEAGIWFSHGLDLASDDATRTRFLFGRARARSEIHDLAGARSDLDRLDQIVIGDPVLAANALLIRGEIDRKSGNHHAAASRLREAADRLEALGQPGRQALALRLLGITEMTRGDHQLARQALEASRAVASAAGDIAAEAWALQSLGWYAFQSGSVGDARVLVDEAVKMFTQLEDRAGLAWARGLEAWVAFHTGDSERARELIGQVLPETQRRGDPWAETIMLVLASSLELWSGNAEGARALSQEAHATALRADDLSLRVQAMAVEGRSLVSVGRVAEGSALLEQAFALVDRAGDLDSRRLAVVTITASAARLGEAERAIRWAARFDGVHEGENLLGESDLAVSLALALLQRGAVDEAASQLNWIGIDGTSPAGQGLAGAEDRTDAFALAVGSIVAAAVGDTQLAARRAHSVLTGPSTYLDQLMALGTQAALAHQRGDRAECQSLIDDARALLVTTDDRVSPLLVDMIAGVCGLGSLLHAEVRLRGIGVDPAGWRQAWSLAAEPGNVRAD